MTRTQALLVPVFAASFATIGFAAGPVSTEAPFRTEPARQCKGGKVWDKDTELRVDAKNGSLSDDVIDEAAREPACDGQYRNALRVLAAAANQNDPRILNCKSFALRKSGRSEEGMYFYRATLKIGPNDNSARSCREGQAMIPEGHLVGPREQLREITDRGGKDIWAHTAPDKALRGAATTRQAARNA